MRLLVAVLATAVALSLVAGPALAGAGISPTLRTSLDAALSDFSGAAGVVVSGPSTGFRYARGDDRVFPAASLYKVGVMVEAYRQAAPGAISLDGTTVTILEEDTWLDSSDTPVGETLTVRAAIERMITVSDNGPAQALLRLLDTHNVNATFTALGLTDTRINTGLPEAEQQAPFNTTSARDMERLFLGLLSGTVVGRAESAEMLAVLERQRLNDRLPSGLPPNAVVAHKTGNLDGIAHDAGVVMTPYGPRIVVMLTSDFADYGDVVTLAGRVSAAAWVVPAERLSATVAGDTARLLGARPGDPVSVTVLVTSTSTFTWTAQVRLGSHWRDREGRLLRWDSARVALPPLGPGESTFLTVTDLAPRELGGYVLEWELVDEGVAWSGDRASFAVQTVASAR